MESFCFVLSGKFTGGDAVPHADRLSLAPPGSYIRVETSSGLYIFVRLADGTIRFYPPGTSPAGDYRLVSEKARTVKDLQDMLASPTSLSEEEVLVVAATLVSSAWGDGPYDPVAKTGPYVRVLTDPEFASAISDELDRPEADPTPVPMDVPSVAGVAQPDPGEATIVAEPQTGDSALQV